MNLKENVVVKDYRDSGFRKHRHFKQFSNPLQALGDAMDTYAKKGDHTQGLYKEVDTLLYYGVWTPIGRTMNHNLPIAQLDEFEITSYDLSLALFDPWDLDFNDLSKRVTNLSMKPWLRVTKSTIPDAGGGLFAMRTFNKGEIISVYCGGLKSTLTSQYGMKHHGKYVDVMKRNKDVPLYWGAHMCNDLEWTPENTPKKKKSRVGRTKPNAEFEGLLLVAVAIIKPRMEIFASYNYTKYGNKH
jgi:hypothetical protein